MTSRFLYAAISRLSLYDAPAGTDGGGGGGAPAAPAATPEPTKGPIATAVERARNALTSGSSFGKLASDIDKEKGRAPVVTPPAAVAGAKKEPAPAAPAPAGTAEPAGEGKETPEAKEPDPSVSPAAGEAGEEPVEGEEDVDAELVAEVPGRFPEEEPIKIVLEDKATADRLRQLVNGYGRMEQVRQERAQVAAEREQVDEFYSRLEADPVSFVLSEQVTPAQRVNLALTLITDEAVWEKTKGILNACITKPESLRLVRAEAETERGKLEKIANKNVETRKIVQRNIREINTAVDRLVPDGMAEEHADIFLNDCIADIRAYAQQHRLLTLDPRDLPQVLARRLAIHNITAQDALQRILTPPEKRSPRQPTKTADNPLPPAGSSGKAGAPPTRKTPTGADFVRGDKRKREVAATAPGGAGAPTSAMTKPPAGSNLKQALIHARQMFASRKA